MLRGKRYAFLFISLGLLLSSCHTVGHLNLEEDQLLVRKNKIKYLTKVKIEDAVGLYYSIENQIQPKPNGSYLGFAEERLINSKKEWLKKRGKPPSIYSEELGEQSERDIEDYLFDRGFFYAEVDHTVKSTWHSRKKAIVTYNIDFKKRFYIDSINYSIADTNDVVTQRILNDLQKESLLGKGKPLDIILLEEEKTRIDNKLRNAGYANFGRNLILKPQVDSARKIVYLEIAPPANTVINQVYHIGNVYIEDDLSRFDADQDVKDTIVNGIHFRSKENLNTVKHPIILDNLFLRPGELYKLDNLNKTLTQLRSLRVFRFVNWRQQINPDNPELMDFYIELTPGKSMTIGYDLELNTSFANRSFNPTASSALVGTAASASFQKRNLNRKAQILNLSLEAGVELNVSGFNDTTGILNTIYLSGQSSYLFPKFLDYFGIWRTLHKIKNGKEAFTKQKGVYYNLQQKAKSRVTGSVSWQNQINFLQITTFNLSYGFDYQSNNTRFSVNHTGIDYLFPDNIPDSLNEVFVRSLGNQLFTAFLFKNLTVVHRLPTAKSNSFFELRGSAEISGLEILAANKLYNLISNDDVNFRFNKRNIDFSKFIRLEAEGRFRKQFSPKQAIAFRFGTGIAFSLDTLSVPFVKQLYSGGANGLRAWRFRELGPGSFNFVQPDPINPTYFQTGNFKLEMNAEYRFPMFSYFDGALFIDAGNVWTLKEDRDQPGAKINRNFLNDIAIGTGFGIRFNYSLFLLRLDFGIKLRNNYRDETTGSHWETRNWKNQNFFSLFNPNLGIDYPF